MRLNRKWVLAIALVLSLSMAIGGTLAYLTDRDSEANVFTIGNVEIDLSEDFEQGATLIPGVDIAKKPTITNTGKNDAWVWATIAFPAALDRDDASKNVVHFNYESDYVNDKEWTWQDANGWMIEKAEKDGVEYNVYTVLYQTALKEGEVTSPVMTNVYMDPHVDIDPDGELYWVNAGVAEKLGWNINTNGNPIIYVSAYAMQTNGFATVQDAYAAYKTQWTTTGGTNNGIEWGEIPEIFTYEGVKYVTSGDTGEIYSDGEDTVYRGIFSDGKTTVSKVVIHEGITRLNDRSLCKAPTITSVSLPSTLTYIDESVFQQSAITEIEIPENVTYIGKQAFGACDNLKKIVIKAKDVTIGNYVARACAELKEVYIYSDSVTFEAGSMYFTNKESGDASGITFYVKDQAMADVLYNAFSTSNGYGLLIKSIDGATTYYNTLK